jgi:ferredoxin-NADP reductase
MASSGSSASGTIRVAVHDISRMATQLLCAALSQQPRLEVVDIVGKSVAETAATNPHVALAGTSGLGDPVVVRIQQLRRIRPEIKVIILIDQSWCWRHFAPAHAACSPGVGRSST